MNGIHKNNVGQWVAFRNGKPVAWHSGAGAKLRAINDAGTNRVIVPPKPAPVQSKVTAAILDMRIGASA